MSQIVTPLPSIGEVIAGQDVPGRSLRVSGHPGSDRVVLSIWQGGRCLATVRIARGDLPDLTRALVTGGVSAPEGGAGAGQGADVVTLPTAVTRPAGVTDRARTAVTRITRSIADRFGPSSPD